MGLIDIVNRKIPTPAVDPNQLTVQDLEYLLSVLKTATIKGEQIEHFYNLIIKLQNQYITLTKN